MAAKKSRRSRGDGALFYRADRDRWMGRINVHGKPRTVSDAATQRTGKSLPVEQARQLLAPRRPTRPTHVLDSVLGANPPSPDG